MQSEYFIDSSKIYFQFGLAIVFFLYNSEHIQSRGLKLEDTINEINNKPKDRPKKTQKKKNGLEHLI